MFWALLKGYRTTPLFLIVCSHIFFIKNFPGYQHAYLLTFFLISYPFLRYQITSNLRSYERHPSFQTGYHNRNTIRISRPNDAVFTRKLNYQRRRSGIQRQRSILVTSLTLHLPLAL
jgi:hypothetical protein